MNLKKTLTTTESMEAQSLPYLSSTKGCLPGFKGGWVALRKKGEEVEAAGPQHISASVGEASSGTPKSSALNPKALMPRHVPPYTHSP